MLIRQSNDANAAFYAVLATGPNIVVAYRDAKGSRVTSLNGSAAALPLYVKASRSGSTFGAYTSADGLTWTPVANTTVKLPSFGSPELAGIGASSGNSSSLSQASFSSPLVTPGAAVAGLGEQHYYGLDGQRLSDRMDVQANIASGDLVLHGRGLQIAGTGLNLVVDRYYNSLNVANSAGSDFGPGWSMGTGRDVNLTVNGDGSVTFTGPSGYEVTFTQSGGAYVTPTGLDATLVQNGDGTFTLTWHKNGEKFNFNSAGVFTSDVDKNGNTVSFGYNPDGTLNEITDTQGRQVTFSYLSQNGVQLISQMADSTGRLWKYGYDPTTNNLTSYTDPNNKQTSFQYGGPGGLLSQATDPNTNQTNVGYDSTSLEVTQVSFADGSRHSYTYNSGSTVINDALNHATTYGYDSLGRVTSVTDAQSNSTSTTYTADSNVAAFADAKGKTTTFGYDSAGEKLQSVTYPTGAAASWAYNDASHPFYPTSSTDTQGNTLTYTYDANGNQKTTTDQLSSQNQFSANYNANGTVSSTTDARSNSTSYGYDTHGNLTSITPPSPLGGISITPDALSRVHSRTDGKGQTTTYTYDTLDRVTNIAYADSSSIAYTLDNDGNVSAMTDGIGTTNYGYDGLNRQFQKVPPDRSSANYRYDVAGNLVKVVTCGPAQVWGGPPDGGFIGGTCDIGGGPGGGIIGGRETDYAYNTLNELTSLTDKSDRTTTTFGYDPNHNRTTTTYPNGVAQTTTFDDSQRIASVVATKGASTLSSFTYSYTNPANSHDAMLQYQEVDSVNIITTTNTYDVVNRLTDNLISGSVSKHYQYVYDGNGNRVQQFEDGVSTSYSYNAANEIQTAGTLSYTFDGVGNELGSTQNGSPILSFTYNAKNQPMNATGTNASEDMTYTGPDQAERLTLGNRGFNYTLLGMYSETVGAGGLTTFSQVSNTPNLGSARLAPAGASNVKIQTVKQASTVQANTTFYYVTDVQGNILSRSEVDNLLRAPSTTTSTMAPIRFERSSTPPAPSPPSTSTAPQATISSKARTSLTIPGASRAAIMMPLPARNSSLAKAYGMRRSADTPKLRKGSRC